MNTDIPVPLKKKENERWRLDAWVLKDVDAELHDRTKLTRRRVKDLKEKFHKYAQINKKWFHVSNIAGILLFTCVALIFSTSSSNREFLLSPTVVLVGIIGGMVFAFINSLGFQRQYQATLAAGWSCEALVTKIDSQILQLALDKRYSDSIETPTDDIVKLVSIWNDELAQILDHFGHRSANSLKPVEFSAIKFGNRTKNSSIRDNKTKSADA